MADTTDTSTDDFLKGFETKRLPWQNFEEEVTSKIEQEALSGCLGLDPKSTKVIRKPKYFSRDRNKHIQFDISIEVRGSLKPEAPCLIWIVECKHENRKVPVDEIEEFRDKLRQVGAHKGTVVSKAGFQQGCIEIAKASGIGLMTVDKVSVFILKLSAHAKSGYEDQIVAKFCLYMSGEQFECSGVDGEELGGLLMNESLEMRRELAG
jgi:hypothetical protein